MPNTRRKLLQQPAKLIERYVRRLIRSRILLFSAALARRLSRPSLQFKDRKRQVALASTIETIARQAAKAKHLNFQALTAILNLGLFFLIAERDVQAIKIDALTHPDAWQRSLCARVMLLTIHELDMDKVAGNQLRQAMDDAEVPELLRQKVAVALRSVRKVQGKAQKQFALLRNSTIAHRDPDALQQYRAITELNTLGVVKIAAEFYDGTHAFITILPELLLNVGTMPGLLRQISAQANRKPSVNQLEGGRS